MGDVFPSRAAGLCGVSRMEEVLYGPSGTVTKLRRDGYFRVGGVLLLGLGVGLVGGLFGGVPVGIILGLLAGTVPHFTPCGVLPIFSRVGKKVNAEAQKFCGHDFFANSSKDLEVRTAGVPECRGMVGSVIGNLNGTVAGMSAKWMKEYETETDADRKKEILSLYRGVLDAFKDTKVNEALTLAMQRINSSNISDARKTIFYALVTEYAENRNQWVAPSDQVAQTKPMTNTEEPNGLWGKVRCCFRSLTNW
jgi:hypothetical protein